MELIEAIRKGKVSMLEGIDPNGTTFWLITFLAGEYQMPKHKGVIEVKILTGDISKPKSDFDRDSSQDIRTISFTTQEQRTFSAGVGSSAIIFFL